LTSKAALGSDPDLKIEILADKKAHTLTIRDNGVGMTKEQLKKNLGTIAKVLSS
jgi:HSP90 family molecular chaperone